MIEFEQIYRTYFKDVFLYIRRLAKDESIAEEITSEAFFKAMHSLHSFRGDCEIRVWLCQIAKNCYLSYRKKQQHFIDLDESDTSPDIAAPDDVEAEIIKQNDTMQIHRFLHELPEPYKEVFMLRVLGELSFKQIGAIFHKTENWACVTYHRAKTKIAEKMEDRQ